MVTVTDFFCGMGGSSTGLVAAGYAVKLAANHWDTAIATLIRTRSAALPLIASKSRSLYASWLAPLPAGRESC